MTAQGYIVMLIFLVLISVARSCIIPFLSLYLKFVGLEIFEVGLIQGIKSWIAIICIALFSSLGKHSLDRKWKRVFISGTLTISLTACTCLMYVPPHQDPPDVTHCRMSFKLDTSTSMTFNTWEHSTDNTHSRNSSNVSEFEFQAKSVEKNMVLNVSTKRPGLFPTHTLTFKIPSVKTYYNTENNGYINKDKQNRSKSVQELFTVYKNNTYLPHNLFNSSFSGVNSASHLKYFPDVENDNISFSPTKKFNKSRHDFSNISDELVTSETSSIAPYSGLPFHGASHNEGRKLKHDRGKNILPHSHVLSPWSRVVNTNYIKPDRISYNTSQHYDLNNSRNVWNKLSKILSVDSNHLIESDKYSANKRLQQRTETPTNFQSQYRYFDRPIQAADKVRNKTFITQQIFDRVKKDNSAGNLLKQQILPYQRKNPSLPNVTAKISKFNPALNTGTRNRSSEQITSVKADNIDVLRRETDTFMTILVLVTFFEIFSSSLKPYCEQFADKEAYSNKLHVWSLLTWGVAGCPILALLTVSLPCPDQLTHHLLLAAILFFLTLVMALFILPIPSKRKLSKPTPKDDTSCLHRICASLTAVVTGISTACYFEFLLWYIDSLEGFPYNYEFLYCGFYSISALVEVLVFMRLHQSAKIKVTGNGDSSTDESEEDFSSEKVSFPKKDCGLKTPYDPVMIGHLLLSIQLCALVFIESAWFLLLLAPLGGCCQGLLHTSRTSHWHAVGYGMGCLFSGIAIETFGMKTLFSTAAGSVFGWSALSFGLKSYVSCRPVSSYSHIPQSVEEDWLEAALQQEAEQS